MVNVSDSALADSPDTRYSFKIPQDTLVDQTLRVNAAEHTPEPPALTKSETEPVIVATNLPPRQPVALAKPFADNGKTPPKASDKVQQIDGRFDQVEKTPAPSIDQTDATPSGQRIALNSVRREKWLKQRQPHEYTVQIMSGPNETGLRQFIERNRFPTTPSYYRARNGQYKLVLPYPDESQARQALKNLPETLRRYGRPWVRSMADVQKDML
jgi:septal ring-binding cell division protein DamX